MKEEKTMTTMSVEGDLLPDVIDSPAAPAPLTLFGNDPQVALQRMADLARVLVDVVRDRKLFVKISGREHLTAEAWTTLGAMLGIVPVVEWTRALEDGAGWEARVVVKTMDGRVVGAAESMCSRAESTWARRDDFALRSMAQTRAISRALRAPLGQIVALAGYAPAGAEETTAEPEPDRPTLLQKQKLHSHLSKLKELAPQVDWAEQCRQVAGVPSSKLTQDRAEAVIANLEVWLAELESVREEDRDDDLG
jgi:hypothetical protein